MSVDTTWLTLNGQTLAQLPGLGEPRLRLVNQAPDVFSVQDAFARFDAAPRWAFDDELAVACGGVTVFRGRIRATPRDLGTAEESIGYEAHGPWAWLDEMPFSQYFNFAEDPDDPDSGLIPELQGLVILGQADNGDRIKLAAIVSAIVGSAISAGCPIMLGTIEGLDFFIPWDQAKDLSHADALTRVLQWAPDAVVVWDYSGLVPSFNVRVRATMPAVTLSVPPPGQGGKAPHAPFESVQMTPRYNLQASGVYLIYLSTSRKNAASWQKRTVDVFPPATNPRQARALTRTVELAGSTVNSTILAQPVRVQFINTNLAFGEGPRVSSDATFPDIVRFWKRKYAVLKAAGITILGFRDGSRVRAEETDGAGDGVIDPACERELVAGAITDWMQTRKGIKAEYQKISVRIRYTQLTAGGQTELKDEVLSATITATSAQQQTYSIEDTDNFTPAEPVPVGLAQSLYAALSVLQWDGRFTLVAQESPVDIRPGSVVNLACAARPEWAAIGALVQSVEFTFATGHADIVVGPAKHLGPDDLKDLYRTNKTREPVTSYYLRTGGKPAADKTAGLTVYTPRNDVSATPVPPTQGTTSVTPSGVIATADELVAAVKQYYTDAGVKPAGGDGINITIAGKGKFRAYIHTANANLGGEWNKSFTMEEGGQTVTYWITLHQLGIY